MTARERMLELTALTGSHTARDHYMSIVVGGGGSSNGEIILNVINGAINWQLISIPVSGKKVKEYLLDWIDDKIKTYDNSKSIVDVVERVTAFPGHLGKALTFVPESTPIGHEGNFNLVMSDGTKDEILGFWIGIKNYKGITGGDDLVFPWNTND